MLKIVDWNWLRFLDDCGDLSGMMLSNEEILGLDGDYDYSLTSWI
jgi:hypothetical protein